jgi:hypothetical protein
MSRRRPVVSSLPLLNHRLLAEMPPASSRSKNAIQSREEYRYKFEMSGPNLHQFGAPKNDHEI